MKLLNPRQTICTLFVATVILGAAQSPVHAQSTKVATKRAPVNGATVTLTDPAEKSFTVKMPAGWRNQAYLARVYELCRPVATSLSPDGKTVLFYGDPRQKSYTVPTQFMNENSGLPQNPISGWSEYVPAADYFTGFVQKKFGKLPGFRLLGTKPNPALQQASEESARKAGRNQSTTAALVYFDYSDKGKPMHGVVSGATMGIQTVWITDVAGVATSGNPNDYLPLLEKMRKSVTFSKSWGAKQQARHEAIMAQLRQDHANQLASWSASNRQHALRMQAISDAGDASMKKWYASQAQSDNTQRRFLNYITEENTVVTGGKTYQVDNSHQRYFVNKSTGKYIGTSTTTNLDDLRRVANVNPDDYAEAKIKP